MPRWSVELLFIAYLVLSLGFVVLERRHPRTTLAWVMAIILLPLLGLLAYLAVGRRPYRRHVRRCRRRREAANEAMRQVARLDRLPPELSGTQRGLVQLALRSAAAPLRRASRVELLSAGEPALASIRSAIAGARHFVHLEFYIWRDDDTGRAITALLTRRAREGLQVRVLCDHVGSLGLSAQHFAPLIEAGGEVAFFAPITAPSLRRPRANFRNHRKLISVDQCVGFVGGLNVGDEYLGSGLTHALWRDLLVRIEGDAVIGLETIFAEDWLDAKGGASEAEDTGEENAGGAPVVGSGLGAGSGPLVQIISSGPDVGVAPAIGAQFSAAIGSALQRCWIATPYLVPDESLKLSLQTAAMRGVDVRLLVPGKSDQWLVQMASRSYYDELLAAGCRIDEYPQMLHSKLLVVDDSLAAIGSANMDIRSFHLNYEVTAMFYDPAVNQALARVFEVDLGRAASVFEANRARITPPRRLVEALARTLSPLL